MPFTPPAHDEVVTEDSGFTPPETDEEIQPAPPPASTGFWKSLARGANIGAGSVMQAMDSPEEEARKQVPDPHKYAFGGIQVPLPPAEEKAYQDKLNAARVKVRQTQPWYQVGKYVRETGEAIPAPTGVVGKAGEMAGGFLPVVASGPAAPITIGMQSYGATLSDDFTAGKKQGLSDEDAAARALGRAQASGLTQAAIWEILPGPLRGLIGKATDKVGGAAITKFLARRVGGAVHGATMGAASTAAQNVTTGRPVTENVVPGAAGLGLVGAVMPFGGKPSTTGEPNAKGIRENAGPAGEVRQKPQESQAGGGGDLEQTAPGQPQPVGQGTPAPLPVKPWQAVSEADPEKFVKVLSDNGYKGVTKWAYDTAPKITDEDIPALEAERAKANEASKAFFDKGQTGDMGQRAQYFTETIRMRKAMDAAKAAGPDADLVALSKEFGVGNPFNTEDLGKDLREALAKESAASRKAPVKTTPESFGFNADPQFPNYHVKKTGEGTIGVDFSQPDRIHIKAITVKKGAQSKGTGSALLEDVKKVSDATGKPITLTAHGNPGEQERLNKFYEKAGFHKTGQDPLSKKPFYQYTPTAKPLEAAAPGGPEEPKTEKATSPAQPSEPPHNVVSAMDKLNIRILNKKSSKPGHEDFYAGEGYKNANQGAGAKRFGPNGVGPDRALQALQQAGEMPPDATVEDLWDAMARGNEVIRAHNAGESPEARQEKFFSDTKPVEKDAKAEKGKPRKENANTGNLSVGDSFEVNGREYTVSHVDPDTGEVQVKGPDGEPITLPDGIQFAIDYGTLAEPAGASTQAEMFGPGAAGNLNLPLNVPPAGAVGSQYSNIAPLDELAQAVRRFPRQSGTFGEKMKQWLDSVGVPIKDKAVRAWAGLRAIPAWIKAKATTLPEVADLDRRVGVWNGEDWTGSEAARSFSNAVRAQFPDRSKLRALSNWINAGGDKALLTRWRDLTKDPALRKSYDDALKFGPDEERLAADVRQYHDEMLAWAQREGALEEGLENYLHRFYRSDDPALQKKLQALEYLKFSRDFNGFKRRYYDSDFEAEQAGLKPEKDAAKRILAYDYGFRQALTARAFVRKSFDAANAVAKDGRPELDVVGGGYKPPTGKPMTLIKPKWRQDTGDPADYRGDYVRFEHPAFKRWHFASTDTAGNPILVDGDILVHPDYAKRYAALFEKSWWGKTPFRRGLQGVSNLVKQTMLQGPFHLVQITTGGIEHRINPFKLLELTPNDPAQLRMAEAGLFAEQGPYSTEGVSGGGLLEKLPIAGEYMQAAKDWLFKDYIPRWKMTLALEAERRNLERYRNDIRAGKITPEQVTRMSARQAAAVFGGQNQRAIFRSKTFQDTLRFMFLAPDFGEERLRQVVQAGGKYGHEQRAALVAGALGLAVIAKLTEKALTGKMDLSPKHIFSVTYNGKEYGLRNPASDIAHLVTDPVGYLRNRLNPVYTRPLLELMTGRDQFGRKRSTGQQLKDEVKQVVPIPARGLVEKEQTTLESFLNSTGLTEHRRNQFTDQMKAVNAWKAKHGYTEPGEFVYDPDKDPYHPLTSTLSSGSEDAAQKQLAALITARPADKAKIWKHYLTTLNPNRPMTGSRAREGEYLKSLSAGERKDYDAAKASRSQMWQKFLRAWKAVNAPAAAQ